MQNLECFINARNATQVIRYLLNLDINSINEKTFKIGIANLVDVEQARKIFCRMIFTDGFSSFYFAKNCNPVQQAIDLTKVLNEDAKENLKEFLSFNQNY